MDGEDVMSQGECDRSDYPICADTNRYTSDDRSHFSQSVFSKVTISITTPRLVVALGRTASFLLAITNHLLPLQVDCCKSG